jgi:DNA-binding IscR family transcriptional regulator
MHNRACGEASPCALPAAWERGQQVIVEYLDDRSLDEFVENNLLAGLSPNPKAPARAPFEEHPKRPCVPIEADAILLN